MAATLNIPGCGKASTDVPPPQDTPQAATPVFSPAAGNYSAAQAVTITTATTGATIYYTMDGSTPTKASQQYTAPITVSTTETIYALASASGRKDSAVTSASYTIAAPPHTPAKYYVSPSGSDLWPGSESQPFATFQYAVNRLSAGDTLYVRSGAYRETVTVPQSGTAGAPITIEAYPSESPVLVGASLVSGPWTQYSGSVYKAKWTVQPTQVFVDGVLYNEARWPNTAVEDFAGMTLARADDGSETSLTYANLPAVDLTGAWVRVMAGQEWVAYDRQIVTHDRKKGKLTWTSPVKSLPELIPRRGNRFYIFGKLNLLDAPGEWWFDPAASQLYVWMPDNFGSNTQVEAGIAPAVLTLADRSFVNIKGISSRGGWFNLQNATSCSVSNFDLKAPNWARIVDGYALMPQNLGGVDISGTGNTVQCGKVHLAGRSGINVAGRGNTVRQVTVTDNGWNWSESSAIVATGGDQELVENNTVQRTFNAGIDLAPRSTFRYNLVQDTCMFIEDCGIIHAWGMNGQGTEVAYNIADGNPSRWGAAIYLDADSPNFYLHDNLAKNILWNGVNVTAPIDIENNTFLDVQHQGINFVPGSTEVGEDWSAGQALHNQVGEPFPLSVALSQPLSIISDYNYFFAYTTLAPVPGPRRVEIDFSQMAQGAWGQLQVPLDLSEVDSILFSIDQPAAPFAFSIQNLRLLPTGATGDDGAVPVAGEVWTGNCSAPSSCTLNPSGPTEWGLTGNAVFQGGTSLSAWLPDGQHDLTAYRGVAFEFSGTASRTYDFQGFENADNGPESPPGRGATLPPSIGADPTGAACPSQ